MHWIQCFKHANLNYETHSPCIPRHTRERVAVSHYSSLHKRNLPETGLPTSSQPESLPYAAKISFFIQDQHLKLLLHTVTHACESWTKWLAAPGCSPIRYHWLLLSSHCPITCQAFAQSANPCQGFTCDQWHLDSRKPPPGNKQNGAHFVCLEPSLGTWGLPVPGLLQKAFTHLQR